MGRQDRRDFIAFFNSHCIGWSVECEITASGDIVLDESMRMIFRIDTTTIRMGTESWSNAWRN